MVRASAKNHGSVAVVIEPVRYPEVLAAVRAGGFDLAARQRLALLAFRHTADVRHRGGRLARQRRRPGRRRQPRFPAGSRRPGSGRRSCATARTRTSARRCTSRTTARPGLAQAEQLSGKEMSYNNYVDADAARRAAYDFAEPCVAIIKHANPCGIAVGTDIAEAHRKAHACDPVSAYGGVIAANRPVSVAMADQVAEVFTEVVVAPAYDDDALEVLSAKKNLRLLVAAPRPAGPGIELRPISGGLLMQTADRIDAAGDDPGRWTLAAGDPADDATLGDLAFAWRAVRAVKSNAILLARDGATVGIGMGQVNRVDSCRLAVARAGDRASGAVAASDAFFPVRRRAAGAARRRRAGGRPARRLGP